MKQLFHNFIIKKPNERNGGIYIFVLFDINQVYI